MHGTCHSGDELHRLPNRHRRMFNYFVKLTTFNELHAEVTLAVALAHLVDGNDAWMVQTRSRFGFKTKALEVRSCCPLAETDDFQCNYAVETLLPSSKYDALSAATNLLE